MTIDEYYDNVLKKANNDYERYAINMYRDYLKEREFKYSVDGIKYIRSLELFGKEICDELDIDIMERWCKIDEYRDTYLSECGLVWSFVTNKFRALCFSPHGRKRNSSKIYPKISCRNYKTTKLHRLLAKYYIPNPNNYNVVRHLNDDTLDWRLENLEWGTLKDNTNDRIRNGHKISHSKEGDERISKLKSKPVKVTDRNGNVMNFKSLTEASEKLNYHMSTILRAKRKRKCTTRGHFFEVIG